MMKRSASDMDVMNLINQLAHLPLFKNVNLKEIAKDLELCQLTKLKQGQGLLTPLEPNAQLYILLEGKIAVHTELHLQPVAIINPGECIGEMSVFEGELPAAYAVAASDVMLLGIHKEIIWRIIESSSFFAVNLLHLLLKRIKSGNEALTSIQEKLVMQEISACLDPLTGIYNRRWMNNMFIRLLNRSKREHTPLFLLMIDIDHFKRYNDEHGHLAGDQCLRVVASALRDGLRATDLLARYGGEEFSVLLVDTNLKSCKAAAERLRERVCQRNIKDRDGIQLPCVSVSIGISQLDQNDSLEDLLDRADRCLYEAKKQGRNRVVCNELVS